MYSLTTWHTLLIRIVLAKLSSTNSILLRLRSPIQVRYPLRLPPPTLTSWLRNYRKSALFHLPSSPPRRARPIPSYPILVAAHYCALFLPYSERKPTAIADIEPHPDSRAALQFRQVDLLVNLPTPITQNPQAGAAKYSNRLSLAWSGFEILSSLAFSFQLLRY